MNDILKEYIEAWSQRIRSPVLGYFIIAYAALNWQELFYIIFSDESVSVRLRFFELRTNLHSLLLCPALSSAAAAFFLPWINFGFSWATKEAIRRSRQMQTSEAYKNELHKFRQRTLLEDAKAEYDRAREDAKIAAAKRLDAARSLENPELEAEILADRARKPIYPISDKENSVLEDISPLEKDIILLLGNSNDHQSMQHFVKSAVNFKSYLATARNFTSIRLESELRSAVNRLKGIGIIEEPGVGLYNLTDLGYQLFDTISKS